MELASNYWKRELQTSDRRWCVQDTLTAPLLVLVCAAFSTLVRSWLLVLPTAAFCSTTSTCCFTGLKTYELTPSAGVQRGFPLLSVERNEDVSYYENEEPEGLHSLVSSHMPPFSIFSSITQVFIAPHNFTGGKF